MKSIFRAAALVALVALVGCGGGDPTPPAKAQSYNISGVIDLQSLDSSVRARGGVGAACQGSGGYDDLKTGTQVVVLNEAGKIVGSGSLAPGTFQPARSAGCTWAFAVDNVPSAAFYQMKVSHRNGPTYAFADMEQRQWNVALIFE